MSSEQLPAEATSSKPLRVAVVGAGPAGFYATEALLKAREDVSVDLFDRLPTPYGLVRFGVAPDHQKIKSVTRLYERALNDSRTRLFGNVELGRDVTHDDLQRHYHAVLYAVGSANDRRLGLPGEDLAGSHSATEFVAWYNGHPDYCDATFPLDATDVVVIGMGNVAIDVTRILAKGHQELAVTDMADHALEELKGSAALRITMIGRRGPAEAKFTTKELRELGELLNADIEVAAEELELTPESAAAAAADATTAKNVEVLNAFAQQQPSGKPRTVALRFLLSPVELLGSDRVTAVKVERNELVATDDGYIRAVGSGEFETIPAQLVFRSVGYRGSALGGLPFDERRGVIPNVDGRVVGDGVVGEQGQPLAGTYVAGWIKRGPSGVIGTNKADAMQSATALLEDFDAGRLAKSDRSALELPAIDELLASRGARPLNAEAWFALDQEELAAGVAQGRPRVKRVRWAELVDEPSGGND